MCTSESRIESPLSKLKENPHPVKIEVTEKTPIGVILVVTLIRTETTLDHSQKAEKVCPSLEIHIYIAPPLICVDTVEFRGKSCTLRRRLVVWATHG